jgi:signal transduction histidine kinase
MALSMHHSRAQRRDQPPKAGLLVPLLVALLRASARALLPWLLAACGSACAQTLALHSALSAAGNDPRFPDRLPNAIVVLPDEWARSRPGLAGPVWYRVRFQALEGVARDEPLALYIEHVCSSLEVWLNGLPVHRSTRSGEPPGNDCNQPQLLLLPALLLRRDGNLIDLKVAGPVLSEVGTRERAGGLSALVVGPSSELAARHGRQMALQVWAPQAVSAVLLLVGGFIAVLGLRPRRQGVLAYFGALALGWACLEARLWLHGPAFWPLGPSAVEFISCSLLGLMTWAAVQFLLRDAGSRYRAIDLGLPLQSVLLALSLVAAGHARLHLVTGFWSVVLALEVAAAGLWRLHPQRRPRAQGLLTLLLAAAAVTGGIEFAALWSDARPLAAPLMQLLLPLLLVLVGLRLLVQQGRAAPAPAPAPEVNKEQLELRVREATAELERNYRQLAELRVEQVTQRERKRIAADLHDDLGAKLLTIVHISDSERISTLAREALEEMRLSVRGLTGKPVRLADALGDWRAEVVSRLAQAGIEGDWNAPEDLPQTLSARAYVQTTRVLREATSNIIKHSHATNCSVSASIAEGDFLLVVQDNGDGISQEVDARLDRGHGLATMKNRAKQLQGQCLVESAPGYGTVIRLTIPLESATNPS